MEPSPLGSGRERAGFQCFKVSEDWEALLTEANVQERRVQVILPPCLNLTILHTSPFFKVTKYQGSPLRDYLRGELPETTEIAAKSI